MKIRKDLLRQLENLMSHSSRVPLQPFLDPCDFLWTRMLEERWPTIRKELDEVMQRPNNRPGFEDLSPATGASLQNNTWKTYFLYAHGLKAHRNCRDCPETARLLAQVPGMETAFFSLLASGGRLPAHRGEYKGVLRYHLGLIVPEPESSCGIRVGDQLRYWAEGKSLIFDDTYMHEAWNEADRDRVILFLDFARPLRFPASLVNWIVLKGIGYRRSFWTRPALIWLGKRGLKRT